MYGSSSNHPYQSDEGYRASGGHTITISDVIGILRRARLLPLIGALLGLAVAIGYISMAPELHRASARILIDRSVNRYLQVNKIVDEPTFEDIEVGSQIYIISSESIVLPVVRAMNLSSDPEFIGQSKSPSEAASGFGKIKALAKRALGMSAEPAGGAETNPERIAVEAVLKNLSVYREDVANVINVTFASRDRNKAANIANALVETYLASAVDAKMKSTKIAAQMVQDRLLELRQQAVNADRALQEYKTVNNLVSTGKGLLSSEQLSVLNTQLTNSRIAVAEAKARLDNMQNTDGASASAATPVDNEVVTRLRAQLREALAKFKELEGVVGKEHLAYVGQRTKVEGLKAAIREEERRITSSYSSEYQLAKARNEQLSATMNQLLEDAGASNQAQVKMRELESSAESLRSLYNSFLQKFNEINKAQSQALPIHDIRIITPAAPPLSTSSKKRLAVLGGSISLGLLLGVGLALARGLASGAFRTAEQVRHGTDSYCAVLPRVEPISRKSTSPLGGACSGLIEEYVLDAPFSRFAESIRNVMTMTDIGRGETSAKVICVVSSVPNEGKSTVATNLAALMAVSSMGRILVIDADLHRRQLTKRLAPEAEEGLIEALRDVRRLPSLVVKRERSGLEILPCVLNARIPNAAELLGSRQMGDLLELARQDYEFIVIETPPIMSVVDTKKIERFVDRFIFIVEWETTKRRLVDEALSEVDGIRDRLVCVVLNKADPVALRSIESYKGAKFKDYYEG